MQLDGTQIASFEQARKYKPTTPETSDGMNQTIPDFHPTAIRTT